MARGTSPNRSPLPTIPEAPLGQRPEAFPYLRSKMTAPSNIDHSEAMEPAYTNPVYQSDTAAHIDLYCQERNGHGARMPLGATHSTRPPLPTVIELPLDQTSASFPNIPRSQGSWGPLASEFNPNETPTYATFFSYHSPLLFQPTPTSIFDCNRDALRRLKDLIDVRDDPHSLQSLWHTAMPLFVSDANFARLEHCIALLYDKLRALAKSTLSSGIPMESPPVLGRFEVVIFRAQEVVDLVYDMTICDDVPPGRDIGPVVGFVEGTAKDIEILMEMVKSERQGMYWGRDGEMRCQDLGRSGMNTGNAGNEEEPEEWG